MNYTRKWWLLIEIWMAYLMAAVTSVQRPFYVIGHMANSLRELDEFLDYGSNAIEIDITFADNGTALNTFHGYPCDCLRECNNKATLPRYLQYVKDLTTPGHPRYRPDFVLLVLDLKASKLSKQNKIKAGRSIALNLIDHLWERGRGSSVIRVLASIVYISDADVIIGIRQTMQEQGLGHLLEKIGWDVSMNEPVDQIASLYRKLGTKRHWQSDGQTNCLVHFRSRDRLKSAIAYRDEDNSYISKVYFWTIDLTPLIKEALSMGVDGILSNHPERVVEVLNEPGIREHYRLATADDDPWEKFWDPERQEGPNPAQPSRTQQVVTVLRDLYESIRRYLSKLFG